MKKLTINDIPDGYNYAAVDSDGFAYAYKKRPIIKHHIWIGNGPVGCIIGKGFDASDWQNSLICKEDNDQNNNTIMKKLTINDIPEGFNWAVVEKNGFAYAYKHKPKLPIHSDYWRYEDNGIYLGDNFDASDWRNSLICKEGNNQTNNTMESATLEKCAFVFSQEPNCIGTTDKDEQIEIVFASDLGLDRSKSGFFILNTKAWSIDSEDDIKQLLDRIRVLIKKD